MTSMKCIKLKYLILLSYPWCMDALYYSYLPKFLRRRTRNLQVKMFIPRLRYVSSKNCMLTQSPEKQHIPVRRFCMLYYRLALSIPTPYALPLLALKQKEGQKVILRNIQTKKRAGKRRRDFFQCKLVIIQHTALSAYIQYLPLQSRHAIRLI